MKTNITLSELGYEELLKLRQSVLYPDKDIDFVKLEDDNKGLHQGVYLGAELVSVISIFMTEDKNLQFSELATLQEHRGKGYASKLIEWMLNFGVDVQLNRIWCNAREDMIGFYERFGFEKTDEEFSKDGHDYVIMEIKANYDQV